MGLPDLTHLQFLILVKLLDGEQSGLDLRSALAERGEPKSGPAFYQLMSRLEEAKYVKGRYERKTVAGHPVKERRYVITGAGVQALEGVREFYSREATKLTRKRLGLAGA